MIHNELDAQLLYIKNPEILIFVKQILDIAPESFWINPSSSTGKHHPADELGRGGLVLHTKRVVKVARCYIEMSGRFHPDQADCFTAAAIVHDGGRYGTEGESVHSIPWHQLLVRDLVLKHHIYPPPLADLILRAVEGHMGRWTVGRDGLPIQPHNSQLGKLLHAADYIASQRDIEVKA